MERATALEAAFDEAMHNIYVRAKTEAKYNAAQFLHMLHERRGVATAKALINAQRESQGYRELFTRGRLDLTVEALVVEDPRWQALFRPEEIERARQRLAKYGYHPRPWAI